MIPKSEYLNHLRSDSCYPAFRKFIKIYNVILVLAGCFASLAGIGHAFKYGEPTILISGVIILAFTKATKESFLMLVDVADAIIEWSSQSSNNK
jgi:hypothetical protein